MKEFAEFELTTNHTVLHSSGPTYPAAFGVPWAACRGDYTAILGDYSGGDATTSALRRDETVTGGASRTEPWCESGAALADVN